MLIEEAQTRSRIGISHLTDEAIKGIMLALVDKDSAARFADQDIVESMMKGKKMVGNHSYDMLADRDNARDLFYIPYYYPERSKLLPKLDTKPFIADSEESIE